MNLAFLLKLAGFDPSQPGALLVKLLALAGREPVQKALGRAIRTASDAEKQRLTADLASAAAAMKAGQFDGAAAQLTHLLFSIKP